MAEEPLYGYLSVPLLLCLQGKLGQRACAAVMGGGWLQSRAELSTAHQVMGLTSAPLSLFSVQEQDRRGSSVFGDQTPPRYFLLGVFETGQVTVNKEKCSSAPKGREAWWWRCLVLGGRGLAVGKLCLFVEVRKGKKSGWKEEGVPAEPMRTRGLALRLGICQTSAEIGKGYLQDKAFQV